MKSIRVATVDESDVIRTAVMRSRRAAKSKGRKRPGDGYPFVLVSSNGKVYRQGLLFVENNY